MKQFKNNVSVKLLAMLYLSIRQPDKIKVVFNEWGRLLVRKLYLRSQSASTKNVTVVHDIHGQQAYLLTGRWGLRADVLSLYSISGQLLAEIKQASFGLVPRFHLFQNRQQVGSVGLSLGFSRELVYIRGLNWIIVGHGNQNRYRIFQGRRLVCDIQPVEKSGFTVSELTVNHEVDEPLSLLLAAVLNHYAHRGSQVPLRSRLAQYWKSKQAQLGNA